MAQRFGLRRTEAASASAPNVLAGSKRSSSALELSDARLQMSGACLSRKFDPLLSFSRRVPGPSQVGAALWQAGSLQLSQGLPTSGLHGEQHRRQEVGWVWLSIGGTGSRHLGNRLFFFFNRDKRLCSSLTLAGTAGLFQHPDQGGHVRCG